MKALDTRDVDIDTDYAQIEIGGMNGIRPLLTGIKYNVPTIDGDFMGRAYPRIYILTPYREYLPLPRHLPDDLTFATSVYGMSGTPCAQSDGMGNVVTVNKCSDFRKLEKIHRKAGHELGLFSQMVLPPISVKDAKRVGTLGTTSLAWYIGRAVYLARQEKTSIMKAIVRTICFSTPNPTNMPF